MDTKKERYRKFVFLGIIFIALGVTFSTTMKDRVGSLGSIFIAVGGLFFVIGMSMKRKDNDSKPK